MLRYILKAYGHAARLVDAPAALAYLLDQSIPEIYARNLLSLAESRCRLQYTLDGLTQPRPFIRTVIDSRLTVEWRDDARSFEQMTALAGVTGEEVTTDEHRALPEIPPELAHVQMVTCVDCDRDREVTVKRCLCGSYHVR